jgi:hypothetical protein
MQQSRVPSLPVTNSDDVRFAANTPQEALSYSRKFAADIPAFLRVSVAGFALASS